MKRSRDNASPGWDANKHSIRLENKKNALMKHVLFILTAVVFNRQNIHGIL